jgi:hypothetical protein
MGLIRAIAGSVIGIMILRLEGWPLSLIIEIFNFSPEINMILLFILVGTLVGLVSGSTLWGITSCVLFIPSIAALYTFVTRGGSLIYYIQRTFQIMHLIYIGVGGLIGGSISGSLLGEDYVILKVRR